MSHRPVNHDDLNRMKNEALKEIRRTHKHEATSPSEWPDPNTIMCKCGRVMGFVRDPKKVKP